MVKLPFSLFFMLIIGQNILSIPVKESFSDKLHNLQKTQHSLISTEQSKHGHRHHSHHRSYVKTRNEIQRCTIFCPIIIIFPNSNTSSRALKHKNTTKSSTTTVKLTSKPTPKSTSKKPLNQHSRKHFFQNVKKEHPHRITDSRKKKSKNKPSVNKPKDKNHRKLIKHVKNGHTRIERSYAATNITKARTKLGAKKYTYRDLNSHQKRLVLKQLNLGNSHGKKAYEFRETSTSLCRVVCLEKNVQSTTPVPQKVSTEGSEESDEDSNEEDEDSYEEGEDTPIEVTIKPAIPHSIVIGGIRPFGPVNFIGFDDFGPSGDLAKDIPRPW